MSLTSEDLQAISNLMEEKLEEKLEKKLEEKLQPINNRLDKLESQTEALRVGQIEIRKDIKALDKKVEDTYQLALDAWGTSFENRKWLESTAN